MTTLTLNKGAMEFLGTASKARVQIREGGALRIRPTARKSGVNLPRGEKLVDVVRKGDTARIVVEGFEAPAGNLAIAKDKYGWAALAGSPARGAAAVKIAA